MNRRSSILIIPVFIGSSAITGFLLFVLFFYLFEELTLALHVILTAITVAGVIFIVAVLIFGIGILNQNLLQAKERTIQAHEETKQKRLTNDEYKVRIVATSRTFHNARAGDQVYQFDALNGLTTALHLQPGPVNGNYIEPTEREVERWMAHQFAYAKRGESAGSTALSPLEQFQIDNSRPELLPALTLEQRLLLLGPSGSGKSSLLRHVVAHKLPKVSQILLCDPHGSRPKWGSSIDAIGFGEDFEAILDCFKQLEWLHRQRIQQVANGAPERSFPVILCVIEEIQAITEYFKSQKVDVGHYIRMFLTRTRKTSIDVIAVTQSDGVKALALEGFSQNKDAFAIARARGRDGRGHQVEYTNEHQEKFIYDAPPLWPDHQSVGVPAQKVARLTPAPTSEQYKIIDILLTDPNATDYQICKEIWGKQGSSYKRKIDEVKELFGPF